MAVILNKKLWRILKFLILFGAGAVPLYLIMFFNFDFLVFELLIANHLRMGLSFTSLDHSIFLVPSPETGYLMPAFNVEGKVIGIDRACTGYKSMIAFLALVFATPKKGKKKALLLLPVIYAANIVRIQTTIMAGASFGKAVFDFVHTILWREMLIILIIGLWYLWLKNKI